MKSKMPLKLKRPIGPPSPPPVNGHFVEKTIKINVKVSKTKQEKQFEPLNYQVEMESTILPNEVSSEFRRVSELLEDEVERFFNTRL